MNTIKSKDFLYGLAFSCVLMFTAHLIITYSEPEAETFKVDLPEEFPIAVKGDTFEVYKIDTVKNTITVYLKYK